MAKPMQTAHKTEISEVIRQQILDAAESRFSHYGYNKTTMAEIAEDAGMSAANLYRYFENKQDIMIECASHCMNGRIEELNKVLNQTKLDAIRMLENYVLTTLHFSHKLASENKKINELVEVIKDMRPDLIHKRVNAEIVILEKILQLGIDTNLFEIDNTHKTARAIHTCTVVFDVPIFMNLYPLEEFEDMARSIVKLIIKGIRKTK